MQNNLIDKQLVEAIMAQCGVDNLDNASIRDTVKIANLLEKATGEKFIRMEMGVPGLSPRVSEQKLKYKPCNKELPNFILCWKVIRNYRKKHPAL